MSEAVAVSAVRIEASFAAALGVAAVAVASAAGACRIGAVAGALCAIAALALSRRADVRAGTSARRSADVGATRSADVGASRGADVGATRSADVGATRSADVGASRGADVGASPSADVGGRGADVRADLGELATRTILGAIAAAALAWSALQPPADLPLGRAAGYRALSAFALFFLSAYLCGHLRASFRKARFLVLLACFAVLALARALPFLDVVVAVASAVLLRELGGTTGELAGLVLLFPPQLVPAWLPFALALLVLLRRVIVLAPASATLACAAAFAGVSWLCDPPAALLGLLCAAAAATSRGFT